MRHEERYCVIHLTCSDATCCCGPGRGAAAGESTSHRIYDLRRTSSGSLPQGLREFGYVEGKNVIIEYRAAQRNLDRYAALAAEFVKMKFDVIVTGGDASIRALNKAMQTIPIVMVLSKDPVGLGYIESLARPGGNIAGLSVLENRNSFLNVPSSSRKDPRKVEFEPDYISKILLRLAIE